MTSDATRSALLAAAARALFVFALLVSPSMARSAATAVERLEIVTATGSHSFEVEVARTVNERERGLMFRRSMPQDHGMLFFFDDERPVAMWMKNTFIPLDMVFVSRSGRVAGLAEETTPLSETIIPSGGPAFAVIELNGGVARAIGLKVGDLVRHPGFAP
jgi:uncharacterized membrane protein (UPF0127 family)